MNCPNCDQSLVLAADGQAHVCSGCGFTVTEVDLNQPIREEFRQRMNKFYRAGFHADKDLLKPGITLRQSLEALTGVDRMVTAIEEQVAKQREKP